jgi:putative endonuclease
VSAGAFQVLGALGEELAVRHLTAQGFRVIVRNYRCLFGEIDLIALEGEVIVFVEVKTRRSDAAGAPGDSVHSRKRIQIIRSALHYLKRYGRMDASCRFDVVSIVMPAGGEAQVELVRDAFAQP